mmetsp:Transcript_2635/g.7563  ORF Transcript_2635/g.7563 Transcript_2635/m.7563 type:complete len:481 (-) Transcript_2635:295-1737(-)
MSSLSPKEDIAGAMAPVSSYDLMEKQLSSVAWKSGEDTPESSAIPVPSRPAPQASKSSGGQLSPEDQLECLNGGVPVSRNNLSAASTQDTPTTAIAQSVIHPIPDRQEDLEARVTVLPGKARGDIEGSGTAAELKPIAPLTVAGNTFALDPNREASMSKGNSPVASPPSGSPTNTPGTSTKGSNSKNGSGLRRGKWTVEEETYVARVIQDFNSGFLDAPAGTTLRSYLSEKLQCDPMRITKKFTGEACIGKRVFHPAVRSSANAAAIDKAQAELDALERRWRRRLEMQQRESAKKAAASAAATNAAITGGRHSSPQTQPMIQGVPVALLSAGVSTADANASQIGQNVVTQAASWLDRANAILRGASFQGLTPSASSETSTARAATPSASSTPDAEIESEMKEVQRLIYEGPQIQKTAAGLPGLLSNGQRSNRSPSEGPPSPPEPADKRMRTGGTISGAEDAEALVGFLRSVRAAAGQDSS